MELNRKNITKIILIIVISGTILILLQHLDIVGIVLSKILKLFNAPFIGLVIAFILNMPMKFYERIIFDAKNDKFSKQFSRFNFHLKRMICIALSILSLVAIISFLFFLIYPEVKKSILSLISELPEQSKILSANISVLLDKHNIKLSELLLTTINLDWKEISTKIFEFIASGDGGILDTTIGFTTTIFGGILNTLLGFIFSLYFLSSKESLITSLKHSLYALLPEKKADKIINVSVLSNNILSKFVLGQCTEAVILGTLCYIGMIIFNWPYAAAISAFVGFASLIPYFGGFMGGLIGACIIILQEPIQAVWFVVFLFILQQLEGDLIYPKVVGDSVGLPPVWVMLAVLVGGSLKGAVGMLIGVPICAILYTIFRTYVYKKIDEKAVPEEKLHLLN